MFSDEYVITFAASCPSGEVKEYISSCIESAKLSLKRSEIQDGSTVMTIGAPYEVLAAKVS